VCACTLVFRQAPERYASNAKKIATALPYVKGALAEAYEIEEIEGSGRERTWEEFVEFLLDRVADPVNRMFTIA
jgi:hypothetical protein